MVHLAIRNLYNKKGAGEAGADKNTVFELFWGPKGPKWNPDGARGDHNGAKRVPKVSHWAPKASICSIFCNPKTALKKYDFSTSPKNVPKLPNNQLSDAQGSNLGSKSCPF